MIEIRDVKKRRYFLFGVLAIVTLPYAMLWFAIVTSSVSWDVNDVLMMIPLVIECIFIYVVIRYTKNSVYRIETEGDAYRLTMLDNHQIVIHPQQVKRILHSGERYVLVLDNKRRLTLEKTSRYFLFSAAIDRVDPWLPLLTKERFPDAEFAPLPLA